MFSREYTGFFIDGAWRQPSGSDVFTVVSPSTGKRIGSVPAASTADIDAAVEAARRAVYETDWRHRPPRERAALCAAVAANIHERKADFADVRVDASGVSLGTAVMAHVE